MNSKDLFLMSLIVLTTISAQHGNAQASPQRSNAATQTGKKPNTGSKVIQPNGDDGQRIFEDNCARCHDAPDGFSPRISGTIVRHMRVRASLSAHDEKELLRFLNP